MPRPKRSKVPLKTAAAPRVAKPSKSAVEPSANASASPSVAEDMDHVSDPEEAVVTSVRRVKRDNGKRNAVTARGRTKAAQANTRGLVKEDSLSEPGESRFSRERAPGKQSIGEGLEDIDLVSSSPAMEVGRRENGTPAVGNTSLAIGTFKRRPRQPSILGRAADRTRSSSVESDLAQDTGLTNIGKTNNSMLRGPQGRSTTTGSVIGNLRSSSIGLGGAMPAHGGSIFNLGNFRKRARQPSILGTAQKERQPRPEYSEDENDFNPDDESTPLNLTKTRDLTSSSSASTSRKRKLSTAPIPHSSPSGLLDNEVEERIPATGTFQVEDVEEDEQSSDEAPLPSIEPEDPNTELMSETMAPPESSSPTPESPPSYTAAQRLRAERQSPRSRRNLRDRTPPTATQDSPMSSPPSLTHSPNLPAGRNAPKSYTRGRKPAPGRSTFSTAQLQALLPQRRRRGARDPFDIASEDEIDVSGLASDDDELTHSTIRAPPSRRNQIAQVPPSGRASRKTKATLASKLGVKKTYGAKAAVTTSDKENDEADPDDSLAPLPDDAPGDGSPENSQEMEKRVGKELKRAARKFQEVDQWELDFEEVTASSSSPKDAR